MILEFLNTRPKTKGTVKLIFSMNQCPVIFHYGKKKGSQCPFYVRIGKFCDYHKKGHSDTHPMLHLIVEWFQYDGMLEYDVLSEEMRKTIARVLENIARVYKNSVEVHGKHLLEYVTVNDTDQKEYTRIAYDGKSYKVRVKRQNYTKTAVEYLTEFGVYRKYRKMTMEYRKKHGIKDKTYESYQEKKIEFVRKFNEVV